MDPALLAQMIADAWRQYHMIQTGQWAKAVKTENYAAEYPTLDPVQLLAYIKSLEAKLADLSGACVPVRGAIGVVF